MNRRFNNYLEEEGMAKFCSEFFINLKDWEQIKLNCTRNRYFLCTEDVNDYPESKTSLSKILSEELLKIFVDTTECK
ncbi:MAG: hypothetical protein JNM93_04095 [Bacteriovoracaceae bacterium]|nr:hypothetical protein [Bacteriovoracaceae bacterium]